MSKCKACGADVALNPETQDFNMLCMTCVQAGIAAEGLDQYDLDGYWNDDNWAELGGTPFVRDRDLIDPEDSR